MDIEHIRNRADLLAFLAERGVPLNRDDGQRAVTAPGLFALNIVLEGVTAAQVAELRNVVMACARAYGATEAWAVSVQRDLDTGDDIPGSQEVTYNE